MLSEWQAVNGRRVVLTTHRFDVLPQLYRHYIAQVIMAEYKPPDHLPPLLEPVISGSNKRTAKRMFI